MPFRLATLLFVAALLAGCTAQHNASEMPEADTPDPTMNDTPDAMPPGGAGGAPNVAVYLDGTWDLSLTSRGEGAPITGAWTVQEGGANSFRGLAGMDAPIQIEERSVSGDTFHLSGVADSNSGPLPFEASGVLNGNTMTGEITIASMGTYDLAGTRRVE